MAKRRRRKLKRKTRRRKTDKEIITGRANLALSITLFLISVAMLISVVTPYWAYATEIYVLEDDFYRTIGLYLQCTYVKNSAECERNWPNMQMSKKPTWQVFGQFVMPFSTFFIFLASVIVLAGYPDIIRHIPVSESKIILVSGSLLALGGSLAFTTTVWCADACERNYVQGAGQFLDGSATAFMGAKQFNMGWSAILAMILAIVCMAMSLPFVYIYRERKAAEMKRIEMTEPMLCQDSLRDMENGSIIPERRNSDDNKLMGPVETISIVEKSIGFHGPTNDII